MEKESALGKHASGRNSGVLHAGFYYDSDSLKARFCREGNLWLTHYCEQNNLPILRCGKLVVATNEQELTGLKTLFQRGQRNGIPLQMLTQKEAYRVEPKAATYQQALFSPSTACVQPQQVVQSIAQDLQRMGVEILLNTCYLRRQSADAIVTNKGAIQADYIVNAAGLYADKIAHDFHFGKEYVILPFKGLYLYSQKPQEKLNVHIYPVPNLKNPFLGVHFTKTTDGKVKIGPTAIPAFWRENYQGWENFSWQEAQQITLTQIQLFFQANFPFRRLALQEMPKYYRPYLVNKAKKLVHQMPLDNFTVWGKPGIRAQLMHRQHKKLIMDFCLQGDHRSLHVLNAVSPAFTCSYPFASHVCNEMEKNRNIG
jgi:L-2-hydroxyglutarate oxidase LhgO